MSPIALVIAHQGGWDEVALIGAPIVLIVGALVIAKRRIEAKLPDTAAPEPPADI
jgi:hypothetical protein